MKFSLAFTSLLSATTLVSALPPQLPADGAHIERIPSANSFDPSLSENLGSHQLEKRRGGGGGRGGGSSGGRSGSSGSSGGRSVSSYSFSSSSNTGGRTRDGSGSPPAYGGRYTGGAAVPYTAGARSPTRSVAPFLLPVTALAFFPGLWLYSVYAYPYAGYGGYSWRGDDGRNRTANVTCLCQEYSVCGCDPGQDNQTILAQQLTDGRGSGAPVNTSAVKIVDFGDGNTTAYINGTLDNGTTASGGTEPSNESQISAAVQLLANYGGYWMAALVASLFITVA
ncbi:hypothetical protein PMZ80_008936 [Knufia obscura]|uniref:DUF7732 domain-containing protein n=2 Tax=Knufia TaxID=430999 RepID=A0AAN8FBD0_9EURO|nr:hypothetical protein PMZ80_008936 [Knufia obscura]KAK5955106.1 hypothetical protein OHC33_003785 [Knufia fluminis]